MSQPVSFESLPNEILSLILDSFSIKELLPIASTSRQYHSTITGLLHRRLLDVLSHPDYNLILECYHPSAKISTPYLSCRYLGTKNLSDGDDSDSEINVLKRHQYVSYRPIIAEENRRRRRRHLHHGDTEQDDDDSVTEDIYLDEDQLFSQLCTQVNLVKPGPKPGLFLSHVDLFEGVLRVWRDWLAEATDSGDTGTTTQILWVDDAHRTVGLRFSVSLGPMERMPVLTGPDDNPAISYKLVYEELLVSARDILLGVERSAVQEISHTGKAIVIASM